MNYVRDKLQKLSKDDTPMVRRGAAKSMGIMAEGMMDLNESPVIAEEYMAIVLKALLTDDNDSVKIQAV